jgi:hypothetical protein
MEFQAMSSRQDSSILGHDISKARLTPSGWAWIALYLGLPVLFLGNLVDLFFQWALGWCIGVWCMV